MSEAICISCQKPRASTQCEVCAGALCKACVQFLEEGSFSFLEKLPEPLSHTSYCGRCFDAEVAPALASYNETLERANQVYVFFKTQKRQPKVLKRAKERIRVSSCPDRDETILRLAFRAAQASFNAVIETDVAAEKLRNGSYQKSSWSGSGVPAEVDSAKIEREEDRERR
jgi:hypothetical protein